MSLPLLLLSIGAIFIGYLCKDMFMGMGTSFFGNSIFVLPANINLIQAEFLHALIKSIPVIFSLIGAVLSVYFYHKISPSLVTIKTSYIGKQLYTFFNNK